MGVMKGSNMVNPEYQDVSSDSDQDVHMHSGPVRDERRNPGHDSAISSCSGSPSTPSGCPFQDPASRFAQTASRPSVIVASANLNRTDQARTSGGQRMPLPPPKGVTCEIAIQPKPKMRFRYTSEYKDNRGAHIMVGQDSTKDHTTYPSLLIKGWNGPAVVVVSLVQDENYHLLHPHSLVLAECDKEGENDGFVRRAVQCDPAGTMVVFNDLCLIRSKIENIAKLLPNRYKKIDPFGVGYKPADKRSINAHAVRLCFEVYMEVEGGYFRLPPEVSRVIRNSGAHQTLKILNLGFCPISDNSVQEVILLCDKVDKDDIEIELLALERGQEVVLQTIRSCDVHGQVAITFKLHTVFLNMTHDNTYVRLRRPITDDKSAPYKFTPPRPVPEPGTATSRGGLFTYPPTPSPSPSTSALPPVSFVTPSTKIRDHTDSAISFTRTSLVGSTKDPFEDMIRNALDEHVKVESIRQYLSHSSSVDSRNESPVDLDRYESVSMKDHRQTNHFFVRSPDRMDHYRHLDRLDNLSLNHKKTDERLTFKHKSLEERTNLNFNVDEFPKSVTEFQEIPMNITEPEASPRENDSSEKERSPPKKFDEIDITGDSSNLEIDVLGDDKDNGDNGNANSEENISDLISSETLREVEKAVLAGVDNNTVFELFDQNGEDKMSTTL